MYTRCEHCQAVLPIRPEDLAQAGGMVRCGSCGRTVNALSAMFREVPGEGSLPIPADGMPPLLNPLVEQDALIDSDGDVSGDRTRDNRRDRSDAPDFGPDEGRAAAPDFEAEPPPQWARILWPSLAVVAVAVLALQLFGPEQWRVSPAALGLGETEPAELSEVIELVSRDLHGHPTLSDAVIVSAILVNRSTEPVPWPRIDLRLYDPSQQVIGQKLLEPDDYLDPAADPDGAFAPNVRLPVVLEMVVEGSQPSGFSMAFL